MKVTCAHTGRTGTSVHDKTLPFYANSQDSDDRLISIKADDQGEEAIYLFSATAVNTISVLQRAERFSEDLFSVSSFTICCLHVDVPVVQSLPLSKSNAEEPDNVSRGVLLNGLAQISISRSISAGNTCSISISATQTSYSMNKRSTESRNRVTQRDTI